MKKLLGLIAVALVLSFATVSVGWAAPAQTHAQQKKEQPKKVVKQPNTIKHQRSTGKTGVKAPASHTRNQIKSDHKAKTSVKAPVNHTRSEIRNDRHQIRKVAADKVKPETRDRHYGQKNDTRHEQPRIGHQDTPTNHRFIHRHNTHQRWPDGDVWHRRFRDWSWFGSHRAHNFDTCYNRHGRPVYVSYEPLDSDYYYSLEVRYGECHFRERHYRHGEYGWCYYWFGGGNIIALFVGDDGYSQTFIWQRDEVESEAVVLGILTPDLQIVYGQYDAAMPPALAASYTRDILWTAVDDDA